MRKECGLSLGCRVIWGEEQLVKVPQTETGEGEEAASDSCEVHCFLRFFLGPRNVWKKGADRSETVRFVAPRMMDRQWGS